VHLCYVREGAGHALIGARQWIPREQIEDPVRSLVMGLPLDLEFRTKGQLAIDVCAGAYADGSAFDFACGDEVYRSCTQLREFVEARGQAYVLRVPSNFTLALAADTKMTCAQAVTALLQDKRRGEIRSAGHGSKGQRWYAWAWLATASPRHHLLIRRHLRTGELAFHYCWVPDGQLLTKARLIRAAGLGQQRDRFRNPARIVGITALAVDVERRRVGEPLDVCDELIAAHGLVELPDRPGEAGACGRERLEAGWGKQTGRANVPRVGHHKQLLRVVQRPKARAPVTLGHADPSSSGAVT